MESSFKQGIPLQFQSKDSKLKSFKKQQGLISNQKKFNLNVPQNHLIQKSEIEIQRAILQAQIDEKDEIIKENEIMIQDLENQLALCDKVVADAVDALSMAHIQIIMGTSRNQSLNKSSMMENKDNIRKQLQDAQTESELLKKSKELLLLQIKIKTDFLAKSNEQNEKLKKKNKFLNKKVKELTKINEDLTENNAFLIKINQDLIENNKQNEIKLRTMEILLMKIEYLKSKGEFNNEKMEDHIRNQTNQINQNK
jgi:hypothetical protein